MRLNNLQVQIRPGQSCDYHRLTIPYKYAKIRPKVPVFVFNRICNEGEEMLRALKARGTKIICDVDDYWFLDPDHYLSGVYKTSGMSNRIIASIEIADYVTVTTPLMASKVKPFNKNVVVIPNALPFDKDQFTKSEDKESGTFFVYVGGASHRHDIRLLDGLYQNVTFAGADTGKEWSRIKSMAPEASYKNELSTGDYMRAYDGHKAALAPLVDNVFNACKSNLKMLEAGAKGLPLIASPHSPYWNHVDKDVVLWANGRFGFRDHMARLMRSPTYAEDVGSKLAEHVRLNYDLADANELRRQLIESLN